MAYPLAEQLYEALERQVQAPAAVEEHLQSALEEARRAWPGIALSDEEYVAHVARHVVGGVPLPEALEGMALADLYLALGCGRGDRAALAAFEQGYGEDLRVAHARMGAKAPALDDYLQTVRRKLLVESPPRVLTYGGAGTLRSWLRVAAVRTLLDMTRGKAASELATPEEGFDRVPAAEDDPELAYLKVSYRQAFREAFEQAARALAPEARNVLRAHFVHGLNIDEIAAAHGVHRATAARRLAKAREDLLRDTRRLLLAELSLSREELASVMRLIESKFHVTVERLFKTNDQG